MGGGGASMTALHVREVKLAQSANEGCGVEAQNFEVMMILY